MKFDVRIDVVYYLENVEADDEEEARLITGELFDEGFVHQIGSFEVNITEKE